MSKINLGLCTLLLLLLAGVCHAGDFRDAYWGMSVGEVRELEESSFVDEKQRDYMYFLNYVDTIASIEFHVSFIFVDSILVEGRYVSTHKHSNAANYINDYYSLQVMYKKKYGKPLIEREKWENNQWKKHKSLALETGHVKFLSSWETEKTKLFIFLFGNEGTVAITIFYESLEHQKMMEEAHREYIDGKI